MSYSYQFRLKIIKLVTEQDYGIREVAKLHKISHALVIYWLKAFRERGLDGVKSPHTNLQTPKIVKSKMKKTDIEIPETTDFSPKAFKKLQRELALARAEIAYLKELEKLDRLKQRQKKEKIVASHVGTGLRILHHTDHTRIVSAQNRAGNDGA